MKTTITNLRKIIKRSLLEASSPPSIGELSKRNKPYITSDASLFYWLRQNNHPLSVAHYAMEPFSMPKVIIELVNEHSFLSGYRVIGRISTYMNGYAVYLFSDESNYAVVCMNHKTGGLIAAENIPIGEYELLVEVTDYMRKMNSGIPELDSYISKYNKI
jgi:hypothetical protein